MLSHNQENTLPIEFPSRAVNNVGDIDAIETLAAIDKNLRCQKFFPSQHSRAHTLDQGWLRKIDP